MNELSLLEKAGLEVFLRKCCLNGLILLGEEIGISEPEFYDDLVYRIRKIVEKSNFSEQFRKLINRYKRIGYNPYVMRQTACQLLTQPRLIAMLHSLIA